MRAVSSWPVIFVLSVGISLLMACAQPEAATTATPTATPTQTPFLTPIATPILTATPAATRKPPTQTPTATSTSGPTPTQVAIPLQDVFFRVKVPNNTPFGETVYVLVMPLIDWDWVQHVALTPEGLGIWSGTVPLEEEAMIRYVYDRWDEQSWGEAFKETREASGDSIKIQSRYLLVTPDLEEVEDTIETWNDLRAPALTGIITGMVVDSSTGQPLMDTNVSIGGLHTATDYDGRFKLEDIAAGSQRITIHRTLGDYRAAAPVVQVPEGGLVEVKIALEAARPVQVNFQVELPEDTPPEAEVRLLGSIFQTGAREGPQPNFPFMPDMNPPVLERVAPNRAVITLDLYEGTYLQYFYSIGHTWEGREFDEEGRMFYRSLTVGLPSEEAHRDRVITWRSPGSVRLTLHLQVPPNTTPGVPVALDSNWMTQTGPYEWTAFLHGYPGNQTQYRYFLGGGSPGEDGSEGLEPGGYRTFVFPESDTVLEERIERWAWSPPATTPEGDSPLEVTFRVSVPASTTPDTAVRLLGNAPELASGVAMVQQAGNPWVYETTVRLPSVGPLSYRYDRGKPGTESTRTHSVTIKYSGQILDDWVTEWVDAPQEPGGARPDFITGVYTPDFWSSSFLPLSASTFQRIKDHNADWVAVSSVWSYGQIDPLPVVELRPIRAGAVWTPREDIIAQAAIAHETGLNVILAPQFNMEMSPGGIEALSGEKPNIWWDAWLIEAERLWMWNAVVAEEIGAEALILPGYLFHVFAPLEFYQTEEYAAEFDAKVAALIGKVRGVYGGKLIVSGGVRDFDFPGLADLVGVTTYDTGHPELPYNATVEEWRAGYDALFADMVDPIYERWGKPVFFYTIHLPPDPADSEPTGQELQARQLEGLFQALGSRPWVAGSLSWAYSMIDAPLLPSQALRARLAEAVLAKYYGIYTGR